MADAPDEVVDQLICLGFPIDTINALTSYSDLDDAIDQIITLIAMQDSQPIKDDVPVPDDKRLAIQLQKRFDTFHHCAPLIELLDLGFEPKVAIDALIQSYNRGAKTKSSIRRAVHYIGEQDESYKPRDYPEDHVLLQDKERNAMMKLTRHQMIAVKFTFSSSQTESDDIMPALITRCSGLGYGPEAIFQTLQYIRDRAPIIIHVSMIRTLQHLVNDTHYRNLFEVLTSGGSSCIKQRAGWERRMFNGVYDDSKPFDRPKYGVLNVLNDPNGILACKHYGQSYLLLKKVRLRTTMASCDSASAGTKLACCEHYAHVLNSYNDNELTTVLKVGTGSIPWDSSKVISAYKEVQIHGPVKLDEHVEALFVHSSHKGNSTIENLLDQFRLTHGVNVIWMEPDL